jgi:GTPase
MSNPSTSPFSNEKVILVHLEFDGKCFCHEDLQEFKDLAQSAAANVVAYVLGKRDAPDAKYFAGKGKVEEIREQVLLFSADLVIFNHDLSPSQERNLEKFLQCRVLDRTGLILDIFAQRARSFEGKLQVELARLEHLSTRLVRGWTHLERQKGGIGLRGGPGEKQLEIDRRLVGKRIDAIKERLEKVRKQRQQGRKARQRASLPTITLVGYTNAGKSTLFNSLTSSEVYVAHQLFATLDPTLRRLDLPGFGPIILADTVGFIRHLPHNLVDAFRATLDETREATLLLHVIAADDSERKEKSAAVEQVLVEIGADQVPQLQVYNKIDLVADLAPHLDIEEKEQRPQRVWVSAKSHAGFDLLVEAIKTILSKDFVHCVVKLSSAQSALRAELYALNAVLQEEVTEDGSMLLTVSLSKRDFARLEIINYKI